MRILLLILIFFVSLPVQGAVVTVSNETGLINAVNANNAKPSGGDIIILNAGTYTLSGSVHAGPDPNIALDLLRPVTLQAAAGAAPLLNMSNYIGIRVQYSNSIVDGLTLAGSQFAIQVQDVSNFNNFTVSNVILRRLTVSTTGTGGQAIATGGMLDSIVEYCTVTSTYNSGIALDRGPAPTNSGSNRNLIVNNTVMNTGSGSGISAKLSDYNTIAGNTVTDTTFDGVFIIGGQHNYIGQNTITRPHNGITLTKETVSGRQSNRNYVGNNLLALNVKPGSDALWFDYDSDYNMGFLNEGYNAQEAGMALFNSVGNYVRANNLHDNPFGGIVVQKDPASGPTVPSRNSIQQNYFHDYPNNGGITTNQDTLNDYGFNYIAGNPAQIGQPIAGILTQTSTNSVFYSNVIRDLRQAEQVQTSSSGVTFYLNRHVNTINHYVYYPDSSAQFDSGSPVLGGNYFSDFTAANGNPSNGATPYTNIITQTGAASPYIDHYPYASESLGKIYSIAARIPSAGSYLAIGTSKTIAWSSQGCVLVDIYLLDSNGNLSSTIASNTPDYGYYRWRVPSIALSTYSIRLDCKTSSGSATGKISYGNSFSITPSDLVLLSPQANLIADAGGKLQISWTKSSAIAAVDVYIRYSDTQPFSLVQAAVAADYLSITTPTVTSNRVSVRLAYGGYGDSTDGWFTIRGSSSGAFTSPASSNSLYVGTPYLVEWVAPQGTDYVSLDLIGSGTRNIATQLADFSNYLMLVPDQQGAGSTLRLTFYNSANSILQQISSPAQNVTTSSFQPNAIAVAAGSGQSAAINTAFATPLQVQVTNSVGAGISGVAVTFTAPASGASGSFGGSTTVLTNSSGIATAPAFTANGTLGTYMVTASTGSLSATFSLTNTAPSASTQTKVGYYFNGTFVLDANGNGQYDGPPGDKIFFYVSQQAGDIAVVGDWNGDGRTKAGIYRNGFWILDYNGNGVYDYDGTAANDKFYAYGGSGYVPVVGDWNGDGKSKIGYYHNGFWSLDYNGNGTYDSGDRFYGFGGNPNEIPILGDWNHDGRTKVGIFYVANSNGNFVLDYDGNGTFTSADKYYPFLNFNAGDKPIVGDWSGNGFTKIGIYRHGFWVLDYNGNGSYDGIGVNQDKFYGFGGSANEVPIVGDWNGSGTSKIGIYLNGFWTLDYNGNGSYDGIGAGQDRFIAFGGNSGEQPLLGKW